MCTVSMITDHYKDKWTTLPGPGAAGGYTLPYYYPNATINRYEFDELKKQIEANKELMEQLKKEFIDMKALLKRAKIYDEQNNEPHCEMDDKVEFMRKMATLLGVSIDDIFTVTVKTE